MYKETTSFLGVASLNSQLAALVEVANSGFVKISFPYQFEAGQDISLWTCNVVSV